MFVFTSAGNFVATAGGDANAPAPPSKIQHLGISRSVTIRSDNQAPKLGEGVISLDPGIRTKSKGVKRRRRHNTWIRKLLRIQHNVNELHKKLAAWLCENHPVVLIPAFNVQRTVRKSNCG